MSTCRKSHARIPAAWEARNCRQVGDAWRGAGVEPGGGQDPPVSSPRLLPGQPLDQLTDLLRDRRAPAGIRVGPLVLDQAPVPGEQGAGCHNPVQPQVAGQQPCQGGDHGPVGPVRLRAGDLTALDRDLMPQCLDLHVLRGVVAGEQRQPVEQPGHQQVEEAEERECRG